MKPKRASKTTARRPSTTGSALLSAEEKAAMRETLNERRRAGSGEEDGEAAVVAKIAEMPESDRLMAERIHAIVKIQAPSLAPRTWYGMPAYAKDGKVICFFRDAGKFKDRYSTFGFNDAAKLDDGDMWPIVYALTKLGKADEARIVELVKQAVS